MRNGVYVRAAMPVAPPRLLQAKRHIFGGGLGEPFAALGKRFRQANANECQDFRAKG